MAISSILSSPPTAAAGEKDQDGDVDVDLDLAKPVDVDQENHHQILNHQQEEQEDDSQNEIMLPENFIEELKNSNQTKYLDEKNSYLNRLKAKLAHITTLDLLSLKANNWDYLNNEELEFLDKSSNERLELRRMFKQLSQLEFVKKESKKRKNASSNSSTTAAAASSSSANAKTSKDQPVSATTASNGQSSIASKKKGKGKGRKPSISQPEPPAEDKRRTKKRKNSESNASIDENKPISLKLKFSKPPNGLVAIAPAPSDEPIEEKMGGKRKRVAKTNAEKQIEATSIANDDKLKKDVVKKQPPLTPVHSDKPKMNVKEMRAIKRQYDNTYFTIWKDLSRKDAPKVHRLIQQATQTKLINLRKTSILCAREAKKWQVRTNKSQKDLQAKARRGMREMFNFWKRNEREERELRKKAEKEALDKAKKEEEERESRRQARKLNFLITQTELYSHFIGRKIKTDEIEGTMAAGNNQSNPHHDVEVPTDAKRTEISALDFDSDNEEEIKKAAAANAQSALMDAKERAEQFNGNKNDLKEVNIDDDDLNFQNPTSLGDITIEQPKLLSCTLKEYQVKGLNWLANLYDQGINGILADEMGLGKTVQSISVLAYLAETHNIWGPFLVVSPASTLHNWQQEIAKFVPDFKVLPYWGNAKDRKILRKFWDRKQVTYTKDSPFHVLVTSYQLVVADIQYFQRIKWQYMILDEAQAIKSSQSSRWKSLLGLQCRNRLLLTGTPIQNSMQELWALLHFIMPSLFDNHEEFSEWFSKDIESHAQSNTQLNEQQLRRLHVILKPFMLRRIKKNVQSELGDKIEIDVYCNLTNRQQKLYKMLRSQISLMDLIEKATSGSDDSNQSLINLVMQFRKVCNHPDLFERDDVKSAFSFSKFAETGSFLRESNQLEVAYSTKNQLEYNLAKLIYQDLLLPNENNQVDVRDHVLNHLMNIWNSDYINENDKEDAAFSWLKFVDLTPSKASKVARKNIIESAIDMKKYVDEDDINQSIQDKKFLLVNDVSKLDCSELREVQQTVYDDMYLNVQDVAVHPAASAPPIELVCNDRSFVHNKEHELFNPKIRKALSPLSLDEQLHLMQNKVPLSQFPKAEMLPPVLNNKSGFSSIKMPSMNRFITDSAKLAKLDELLVDLKKNDHRVLIYFQMTKMMDLMEEYLTYRQYKYIRLDGSSKLDDRRDLVNDWQTRPEIFVFLLSTRAGGLGINLTAADTVVFYDSDWNPTIDSQAMDRAHRLGQTRQVTVYRLLVRGTIEERMRDRAKQKEHVQQVVMEGKATEQQPVGFQKPSREVAFWLLDDDEAADAVLKGKQLEEEKKAKKKQSRIQELNNKKSKKINLEDMYHEGEGNFDDGTNTNNTPSRVPTPIAR